MILSSINYLDCLVFLLFLAPQLIYHVAIIPIAVWMTWHISSLVIVIPYRFCIERYRTHPTKQSPFVQSATTFQDIVIRYVRYGFANLPASFGRVFLSKAVSLPFIRWRMLRHGLLRRPVKWTEVDGGDHFKALYIPPPNDAKPPSHVVFYLHGGGFAMGSAYFYLEFLLAWHEVMCRKDGFANPAVLAVEYTLVPDAVYPKQLSEVCAAYEYTKDLLQGNTANICLAGDSAGATLLLSFLLKQGASTSLSSSHKCDDWKPGFCILISPWPTIVSALHENTESDYLNTSTLELYGGRYLDAARDIPSELEIASPGSCTSSSRWAHASPRHGYMVIYGTEEVLAKDAESLIKKLQAAGQNVVVAPLVAMVHAWPVAALYLADEPRKRLESISRMVDVMTFAMLGNDSAMSNMAYSDIKAASGIA